MTKKAVFVELISIFFVTILMADQNEKPFDAHWETSIDANLTLTQNAYSKNWTGGETGALSWALTANALAKRQIVDWLHTKNTAKLAFGQTYSQNKETKIWSKPIKSVDIIDLESIFRFTLNGFVDPFAGAKIESQFTDSRDTGTTVYINPFTFTESFGIAKILIKKNKTEWSIRLGPGFRQYLDRNAHDTLTNTRKTSFTNDGGILFASDFFTPLLNDRITFNSKLSLFQALFYSEANSLIGQPNQDYWKSLDTKWENVFTAGITDYLNVNLTVELLYDRELDPGIRLKEVLALGLSYKFI